MTCAARLVLSCRVDVPTTLLLALSRDIQSTHPTHLNNEACIELACVKRTEMNENGQEPIRPELNIPVSA